MTRRTFIFREKRQYASWVASQTLEDFALRYTDPKARRWSAGRVANTAIGASAFLACEAIGAAITLSFGFSNAVAAIGVAVIILFLVGLPIAYHAAKEGLDIDLLTRGSGFGYLGSTITSLVYASFTFLLFAVEASIMAVALEALLHIPLTLAYILSSLVVIPIAVYGMRAITVFQAWTQPIWVVLQLAPIAYLMMYGSPSLAAWQSYIGAQPQSGVTLIAFGLALSTLLSLLPQIGEQADFLRFLPQQSTIGRRKWWLAMLAGGPGWALIGGVKLLLGSLLAVYVLSAGLGVEAAANPTDMFVAIFSDIAGDGRLALALTGIFVIICQLKINVTNAYAGSIAWSNVFARLTYAHPGRIIWIVFNVGLALLLMLVGILEMVESILIIYALVAAAWIGALAGDLAISKPLGLSPDGIEFKRAHLFDINPVGCGALALSLGASLMCYFGMFGPVAQAFAPVIALVIALLSAPAIALLTHSKFYVARAPISLGGDGAVDCVICSNTFQQRDMAHCPVYSAPICSLCCTLEARCMDRCKTGSSISQQAAAAAEKVFPAPVLKAFQSQLARALGLMAFFSSINAGTLGLIHLAYKATAPEDSATITPVLWIVFFVFCAISVIAAWGIVLANTSQRAAERESDQHVTNLIAEIAAHEATDMQLQRARDAAEAANAAKSRYLVSVSHEIRSPLNSIYGYAQLLERGSDIDPKGAAQVIRRSSEHLSNLVEGLLDISSVENSILRLSRDTVRFPAFLNQIATMFQPEAASKGLEFIFEDPKTLPEFVRTDQKRLRQILINLLSNAIKFTERGSVTLKVSYSSEVATFSIIDTGIGIDDEDRARILEPFERGENSQTNTKQGIGLGLAITNTLVKIMGGDLQIFSAPGRGTTFQVRLMLARPLEPGSAERQSETVIGYNGPRQRVLVVDDDPMQLTLLSTLLRPLGFDVSTASNAATGLALARTISPDVCLLDLTLPDQSGWELAKSLRTLQKSTMKIIMISADAHQYKPGGDGQAAHDKFLVKPLELELLIDAIGALLGLTWVTQARGNRGASRGPADKAAPSAGSEGLSADQQSHLEHIINLANIGQARALGDAIEALRATKPSGAAMAAMMARALEQYDFDTIMKQAKDCLNDHADLK